MVLGYFPDHFSSPLLGNYYNHMQKKIIYFSSLFICELVVFGHDCHCFNTVSECKSNQLVGSFNMKTKKT